MKKLNKLIAMLFVTAFSIVSAYALEAKVVSVTGKVEVQTNGSSWKTVKAGDRLTKGSVISTGFKSSAKISIDNTTVDLGPLTRITVEKLASNDVKDETNLYLDTGKVKAEVKKNSAKKVDFKVSSPVATASVRGTIIECTAGGRIKTEEGLGARGPGKDHAEIDTTDQPSGFVSADGTSKATTSTKDINGKREIAIFEGQMSNTDPLTGLGTNPQSEKYDDSRIVIINVGNLLERETGMTNKPEIDALGLTVPDRKGGIMVISGIYNW